MTRYLHAILLGLVWVTMTGSVSIVNFCFGAFLGAISLFIVRERVGTSLDVVRPWPAAALALVFLKELILSGWRVARLVTSARMDLRPGIFAYPLTVDRDFEITLLANMITLTPGTLSVDVSNDRRTLYVHALDCSDIAKARADIESAFERRILRSFR